MCVRLYTVVRSDVWNHVDMSASDVTGRCGSCATIYRGRVPTPLIEATWRRLGGLDIENPEPPFIVQLEKVGMNHHAAKFLDDDDPEALGYGITDLRELLAMDGIEHVLADYDRVYPGRVVSGVVELKCWSCGGSRRVKVNELRRQAVAARNRGESEFRIRVDSPRR